MTARREAELTGEAWAAVSGGDPQPVPVAVSGATGALPSAFAVEETAVACVATALLAAAALAGRGGRGAGGDGGAGGVMLDRRHVADAVRSEAFFRRDGAAAGAGFAPLSRFWPAADGWVRTHANYPWHRDALLGALGVDDDRDAVAAAMADLPADEIEERVFAAGGIAAMVRTGAVWRAHPQGRALATEPLVGHRIAGDAPPRTRPGADRPAAGVRVLDLTRVIAGPVSTRYLGALGADVVRIDPPGRPDMRRGAVADTLLGKRSAVLDLGSTGGLATVHDLLDGADVVVCGYRPGSLDRFGFDEDALAERHPGLVVVYLDAWGHRGPWAGRRGFDSIVQAPTGIAAGASSDGVTPSALPCQLLDHGTGYLAAAAALDGLRRQADEGGTHVRRLSLARTAWWLTSTGAVGHQAEPGTVSGADDPAPWSEPLASAGGPVTAVAPPGSIGGRPLRWPGPLTGYGDDPPEWSGR